MRMLGRYYSDIYVKVLFKNSMNYWEHEITESLKMIKQNLYGILKFRLINTWNIIHQALLSLKRTMFGLLMQLPQKIE